MHQARGNMGTRKHGTSGRGGPSPKAKFMTAFEANRLVQQQAGQRPKPPTFTNVADLMRQRRPGTSGAR